MDDPREQFEQVLEQTRSFCAGLTEEQMNWSAAAGSWSIAQCLDHLTITARTFNRAIETGLKPHPECAAKSAAAIPVPWWGRVFLKILEPPVRRMKVKAPVPFHRRLGSARHRW